MELVNWLARIKTYLVSGELYLAF